MSTSGRFDGQVAFITGAARGQGRSHAVRLAAEGASIIAVDICDQIDSVPYGMATPEDLHETVSQVEEAGGKIYAAVADVRDRATLETALSEGVARFGVPDIVLANAGISPQRASEPDPQQVFIDTVETNLVGVWNTVSLVAPMMIARNEGGAIVITSSAQGLIGRGGDGSGAASAYTASKHGVVGLMRSFSAWLAPHSIRVNTIHPTGVHTAMVEHEDMMAWVAADPDRAATMSNPMPIDMVDVSDVTEAVLYLVGESGRYITGVTLPVDAGFTSK
ncbi:mycofactocin-coupled SDR family oxidoreductase [Rhodococcus sp. T2V]|uniref:mycofactocin-coupled SDR family oxidoreductase n=1 Tax=Rhodococcus sp. T2V TaxID=3034164 RepID=UPI0023E218F8|nr:mycofactocin-coupled SDR family oxidoreductase [Rhodococcus sp. T2V]MDF3313141.1 mycofactocin-coupled SDR family oxidoreductase [Rhodococcus sp. T2V]